MNSLWWQAHGEIEKMRVENVPDPQPDAGQPLIDVKAASIDLPDMHTVQGRWQFKPSLISRPDRSLAGCDD